MGGSEGKRKWPHFWLVWVLVLPQTNATPLICLKDSDTAAAAAGAPCDRTQMVRFRE